MTSIAQPLTLSETDEAILAACNNSDGAIEDCEESPTEVRYFFETGTIGIVDRASGAVIIKQQQAQTLMFEVLHHSFPSKHSHDPFCQLTTLHTNTLHAKIRVWSAESRPRW